MIWTYMRFSCKSRKIISLSSGIFLKSSYTHFPSTFTQSFGIARLKLLVTMKKKLCIWRYTVKPKVNLLLLCRSFWLMIMIMVELDEHTTVLLSLVHTPWNFISRWIRIICTSVTRRIFFIVIIHHPSTNHVRIDKTASVLLRLILDVYTYNKLYPIRE